VSIPFTTPALAKLITAADDKFIWFTSDESRHCPAAIPRVVVDATDTFKPTTSFFPSRKGIELLLPATDVQLFKKFTNLNVYRNNTTSGIDNSNTVCTLLGR
jgi:hypothetical protein